MFAAVRRAAPSVIFIPDIHTWCPDRPDASSVSGVRQGLHEILCASIDSIASLPVLLVTTADVLWDDLHPSLARISSKAYIEGSSLPADPIRSVALNGVFQLSTPADRARVSFIESKLLHSSVPQWCSLFTY